MIGRRPDDAQAFEEAWNGRARPDLREQSAHVTDLVRFAEGLCEAAVAEPTDEFRTTLRTTLMTEAENVLLPATSPPRKVSASPVKRAHPVRRRVAGLTAAALASAGVIGLVSSSASAVPGDMLYSVKRTVESVELAMHQGDASRGSFQLAQAAERLAEAHELSDNPSDRTDALMASTLEDFSTQAEAGSSNLFDDFSSNGKEKSIQQVNDFAAAATVDLATLSNLMPESAGDSFSLAAKTISELAVQASTLCSSCSAADVTSLVNAVTALTHSDATTDPGDSIVTPSATSDPTPGATSTQTPGSQEPTAPAVTTPPLDLAPVTSPLLGVLLGDETQEGLVPGLLNGLLGPKP